MGQTFSSVFEQFSFTSNVFGLKMQILIFLRKKNVELDALKEWKINIFKYHF